MSFSNPQMIVSRLGNAVKPWKSVDAVRIDNLGRPEKYKTEDQDAIDACLHCPFASCEGTAAKCRSFRAKFIAAARERHG